MTEQEKALYALGLTEEEVAEVLADDKRIDKGEKLFELPDELKAGAKKARTMRSVDAYGKTRNRERRPDEAKAELLKLLIKVIKEHPTCENLEIISNEGQFEFYQEGRKYRVVLSAPRK